MQCRKVVINGGLYFTSPFDIFLNYARLIVLLACETAIQNQEYGDLRRNETLLINKQQVRQRKKNRSF